MKIIFIPLTFMFLAVSSRCAYSEDYSPEIRHHINQVQTEIRKDLSEGKTEDAKNLLEQTAGNFHAVEIELAQIQALMQAGEYRHALSTAAHTQAEHPDTLESGLFYAWLLAIGGETNPAIKLLKDLLEKHIGNEAITLMLTQIKTHRLISEDLQKSGTIQFQPFVSVKSEPSNNLHYLTSGVIINKGTQVITDLSTLNDKQLIRVRNGLGREANAYMQQKIPNSSLVLLRLEKPFNNPTNIYIAEKTPYPGNPIYIIGYTPLNKSRPDWPQLTVDILGTPSANIESGYPIHIQDASKGAGVYNQQGQLIGIIDGNSNYFMLPISQSLVNIKNLTLIQPLAKHSMDEIYEMSLSNTVQILSIEH